MLARAAENGHKRTKGKFRLAHHRKEDRVAVDQCFIGICFVSVGGQGQKFFGFSEYLAGLALMVLAWTIADVRYRFRVRSAPIPLLGITFSLVVLIGILSLLTDLWREEQWLVPKGKILTPASWQAALGGLFLLTFIIWTWYAFIRPPTYGRLNAERFARTLYQFILKGSPEELAIILDELTSSAKSIVYHATDRGRFKNNHNHQSELQRAAFSKIEGYANDILLLIADKRLCQAIVNSSPRTALAIFQAMTDAKKYGLQVEVFSKNIVNAAILTRSSFLYHEDNGYQSGLIGYHKPLSQAMFANYEMVETIGTLFDVDIYGKKEWDAEQWAIYCRLILMTFRSYISQDEIGHSFVLYGAMYNIRNSLFDLHELNGVTEGVWNEDLLDRLRVIVEFIIDAVNIMEKKGVPEHVQLRHRDNSESQIETFYDHIANLVLEIITSASAVKTPTAVCWWVQHNSIWSKIFGFNKTGGKASAIIKFKFRRLLYNEISEMDKFPNYKGARLLGFCLNVMGLALREGGNHNDSLALHKAVLRWTKKNYTRLHNHNPRIAEECLVQGFTYDKPGFQLVRIYPAEGLRRESRYVYLKLDPDSSEH